MTKIMIKELLFLLILFVSLSGIGSAESYYLSDSYHYNSGGNWLKGIPVYPHYSNTNAFSYVGYATMTPIYNYNDSMACWIIWNCKIRFADTPTNTMQTLFDEHVRLDIPGCPPAKGTVSRTIGVAWGDTVAAGWTGAPLITIGGGSQYRGGWTMFVAITEHNYNLTGTGTCLESFEVKINNSGDWITAYINESVTGGTLDYNIPLVYEYDYRIYGDGNLVHSFTCDGHELFDADICTHTTYHLKESCGNLIPDSEGYFCENWVGGGGICRNFYESNGILDISNTTALTMEIYTDTFIGETGWAINPVVDGTVYVLENPNIAWGLKVIVQNDTDGTLIDGAMVKVDQDCYCTSGYSTRQKMTVSGMAAFTDMSLQDASLLVMKDGYKPIDENSTGYAATLSGRSNFSSKTWIVKLAPSSSNNSSSFYEVSNKVDIHFVDVNGNRTSQILDTDSEVYLYYENNNTEEEAMSLKFQSSSTHTYFIDEQSWTIAHDDIGHKTIANSYFTPWDYSYRAVIYNSSIHGWNITIPLTVRNETKEVGQHYKNLTTLLFFMYASDGKVDFRDNMRVGIHACSNNTTLMTVDLELWKDGVYIACNNLTGTDFTGASYPYYVMWDPVFDYVTGSNYSVRMYGFDRTLLETDYVECVTDDTTRKNKLTVAVKDKFGHNVDNAYIYLEGWGSLPTGSTYYNAYEGIDNGDYRYKATKSGYTGSGWDDVNITDEDKIVWYVLSEDYTNTSVAVQKYTDEDIKGFFFPLMFFLLICIVLGGLKYVAY